MTLRILVVGTTGQLAQALAAQADRTRFDLLAVGRDRIDLADPVGAVAAIMAFRPALVVNAAAYTAVDKAESESRLAYAVNASGPAALARHAAAQGAGFIHISTDYVFDGAKEGLWLEDDPVGPLGVYGASKLAGEMLVSAVHPRAVILRTSWVFSATGNNFVRTMLRLGRARPELKIVNDQFGRPTSAATLAGAILAAAPAIVEGVGTGAIYHLSNAGPVTNWHVFAEAIFDSAERHGAKRPSVLPISTADYPTPARRPRNSAMDIDKFSTTYNHTPAAWDDALQSALRDLAALGEV